MLFLVWTASCRIYLRHLGIGIVKEWFVCIVVNAIYEYDKHKCGKRTSSISFLFLHIGTYIIPMTVKNDV